MIMKKIKSLFIAAALLIALVAPATAQQRHVFHKESLVATSYLPFTVTNATTLSWPKTHFVPVDLPYFGEGAIGAIVQINTGSASNLVVTGQVTLDRDGDTDAANWSTVGTLGFSVLGRNAATNFPPASLPGKKFRVLSVQNTNSASVTVTNLDIGFWRPVL